MNEIIKAAFGISCTSKETKLTGLPLYLTGGRRFEIMEIEDYQFLAVYLSDNEKFGTVALLKQLAILQKKSGLDVAFVFKNLTWVQREALIEKRIPFVYGEEQIYLPFLGIALRSRIKKTLILSEDKMMPVSQSLFLYMLYHDLGSGILKKDAAEVLHLTRTSITRASEQLKRMGLISEESVGKETPMQTTAKGKELFLAAKPYLVNPIQRRIYVSDYPGDDVLLAGESALSAKSMLAEPKHKTFACYKGDERIKHWTEVDPQWAKEEVYCVELWKYNPCYLSQEKAVDVVSLAMSLAENEDERVQGELEEYMEGYEW